MNVGDAFLLPTPPNGQHLFFAIAEASNGNYLIVNATTLKPSSDTTCILQPGTGVPIFIRHSSSIEYRRAREVSPTVYAKLVAAGQCIPQGSCSPAILSKIQQGAIASNLSINKHKQIVKDFLSIV